MPPAALGLLLYLASTVATPVIHAGTEVLRAPAGVEDGHSDRCPRIHSNVTCLLVTSNHLPGDFDSTTAPDRAPVVAAELLGITGRLHSSPEPSALRVRAPPSQ